MIRYENPVDEEFLHLVASLGVTDPEEIAIHELETLVLNEARELYDSTLLEMEEMSDILSRYHDVSLPMSEIHRLRRGKYKQEDIILMNKLADLRYALGWRGYRWW